MAGAILRAEGHRAHAFSLGPLSSSTRPHTMSQKHTRQTSASPAPTSAPRITLSELPTHPPSGSNASPVIENLNPLHKVKTEVQVCIGTAVMTVGELLHAQVHQVVALQQRVDQPVDLLVQGQVIARGELVVVGNCFGVRLTELPHALSLQPGNQPA